MDKCDICGGMVWEDRWPPIGRGMTGRRSCFQCSGKARETNEYKPVKYKRSDLVVCDRCGEISRNAKLTSDGWLCEDCSS